MLEGIFEINSYEIEDLLNYINTTSNEVEAENEEAKETFEPNKQSEVFGKGAQTINDQMDEIFNEIDHLGVAMQKGTSAIFETEIKIMEEARALEIPKGFEVKEGVTTSKATVVNMQKEDGTSVNNGQAPQMVTENTVSEIEKEEIEDISKASPEEQRFEEEQLVTDEVALKDIENGATEAQEYDDSYTDNEQTLETMDTTEVGDIKGKVTIKEVDKVGLNEMEGRESQEITPEFNMNVEEIENPEIEEIRKE